MDLAFLRPMYERTGPWTSVYLDASRDTHDAAKVIDLRWSALRDHLAGACDRDVEAIAAAVLADRDPGRHGLALFANGGEVVVREELPTPPTHDQASHSLLPYAMPLAVAHGEEVPWIRVVVDRTGASITEVTGGATARTSTVEGGETFGLTKSKPGGWSAPRYQRAAEEAWDRNAGDVAKAVTQLVKRTGAEIVILAGDVRARGACKENLPAAILDRVVETDAGSRASTDTHALDQAAEVAIAEHIAARHVAITDRFRQDSGRNAVTGLDDVVRALAEAKVDTLLLENDPSSNDHVWIGEAPSQIAVSEEESRAQGVESPERVRADSAILRTLAMTDASLLTVESGDVAMSDGIGALLRYR
ncbi:Vms1/Ankzf1 family peptidyl-tRNA hydrolase [Phytomonospora sp. NPDC050363]|uniref:baeRF2 domain-containing protein n=1 Tax=Phytomonospora sp. NPDC050363 TaxID=3155642 RepID=UPI00341048AA